MKLVKPLSRFDTDKTMTLGEYLGMQRQQLVKIVNPEEEAKP